MSKLIKLPIFFITINKLAEVYRRNEKINIENLGILGNNNIILSSILYTEKKIKSRPYSIFVIKKSYQADRKIIIKYFIEEIIIPQFDLGRSSSTIYTIISAHIRFINWIDDNNKYFPSDINEARNIFVEYTYYLKTSLRTSTMVNHTAHTRHKYALRVLKYIFKDQENIISLGIKLIPYIRRGKKTIKSSDHDRKYHFKFYYTFFHEITNFILKQKPYPMEIQLNNTRIWILPSHYVYVKSKDHAPIAFNYENGNTKTLQEIKYKYKNIWEAKRCINDYIQNINKNNTHFDSEKRLLLASAAAQAFYILFLSITGMNDSTAATLLWNDDYNIEKNSQRFRNIKYRAGNKNVEFEIKHRFIKDFKKYLNLRKYLLGNRDIEYLFFSNYREKAQISKKHINGGLSAAINEKFKKRIDSDLPTISSRILRVNKIHQIIKTDGIIAASQIGQSSINTIISDYQGESEESSEEQFINYFEELNKEVFKTNSNDVETTIGHCKAIKEPTSKVKFNNEKIDCSIQEGCLFCESFALHIDKQDLNKLYSLKYIIYESKYLAKDISHFNKVYSTTLNRIENILDDCISSNRISKAELKFIEDDVFIEENLHPYWEHKLSTLIKMGVVK